MHTRLQAGRNVNQVSHMYEKNCVSNALKDLCVDMPFIILVQTHPSTIGKWHQFKSKVHGVDPSIKIITIQSDTLEAKHSVGLDMFLDVSKGPSCFLFCPSLEVFHALLKVSIEESLSLMVSVMGARCGHVLYDRGEVVRLSETHTPSLSCALTTVSIPAYSMHGMMVYERLRTPVYDPYDECPF
jgi:hypothetical protein